MLLSKRFLFLRRVAGSTISWFALVALIAVVPTFAEKGGITKLRVLAYNVACGQWATPEQIAEVLKPLNPDIVLLSEVPKANRGKKVKDWSHRLGDALGLGHVRVGMVSSANHKAPNWGDVTGNYGGKFKSVLSRTPLTEGKDFLPEGSGAHHKRQPTELSAWEGSKQKALADHINAEKKSYDVIVGGDFNEWTDGLVMRSFSEETKMANATQEKSIDHILYRSKTSIKLLEKGRDWGPKNQNKDNVKSNGCLSDHPWVWCELEISEVD